MAAKHTNRSFRLDDAVYEKLVLRSRRDRRTVNSLVNLILERAMFPRRMRK